MVEESISRDCSAIVLDGLVSGPEVRKMVQFLLDTGASITMLPKKVLHRIGSDVEIIQGSIPIETAGGTINVDIYRIGSLEILGMAVKDMNVAGYDLPVETRIEGLLGLDYLKNFKFTLDFPYGKLMID